MTVRELRRRVTSQPWFVRARYFLTPPQFDVPPTYEGSRLTLKRLLNLYMVRYQYNRRHTKLLGYPIRLTIEAANLCNLRCPGCFTGRGEVDRERSFMPSYLYQRLMDELGDYLMRVELYNWGESLLNKNVYSLIQEANRRGISTTVSTNFSFPFDSARAERLVASGLSVLGVSLDGTTQQSYERYRVGGHLETVLENCRLMNEAKKKLRSKTPRMVWEFHVFEHNVGDVEAARAMARELGMDIDISKGWVVGPDWQPEGIMPPELEYQQAPRYPCAFLWEHAVVNNDGGAAPCCGAFYREDDMGKLQTSAEDAGKRTFREIWNNRRYQESRGFFGSRHGSARGSALICSQCPVTIMWHSYRRHVAAGGDLRSFQEEFSPNDCFNFFFNRGPGAASADDASRPQPL